MKPLIRRSDLTDPPHYYLLTRYRVDGPSVVASTKYDVTDQVEALIALADTEAGGKLPPGTRLILASESLLDQWGTRTERGERITVEWGEPTPEGWYTPTFTAHSDDVLRDAQSTPEPTP